MVAACISEVEHVNPPDLKTQLSISAFTNIILLSRGNELVGVESGSKPNPETKIALNILVRLTEKAKSDLIILAGRPSMGKTALATNIAYNAASNKNEGKSVAFFL